MTRENTTMIKSILFSRWLAMCYHEVLNTEDGKWYANRYSYFIETVYPKQVEMLQSRCTKDKYGNCINEIDTMIDLYHARQN